MKAKKEIVAGILCVAAAFQLTSCGDQDVDPHANGTSVTESFQKIETSYRLGNEKIEGIDAGDKRETRAPEAYISSLISERVNREFKSGGKKSRFEATASIYDGYDVGVVPAGFNKNVIGSDCPSWSERVSIFMDCEDKRPATSRSGDPFGTSWWTAWSIDSNKNLWMVFCRVDGRLFQADMLPGSGYYEYALLKLGYQDLPGSTQLVRHFDNEDSGNTNTYEGDISPNTVDSNTTLNFHYFRYVSPNTGGSTWPDLGFSYGVFGRNCCMSFPYSTLGGEKVSIDDEDSSNANWLTVNGSPATGSTGPIVGGSNTTLYIARRK